MQLDKNMIDFKDITPADRATITAYTLKSDRRNCDLSFSNLCSWRFLYNTKFAEIDGFLLFKFWAKGELVYMMPVGEGDLKAVLYALMKDAKEEGQPFCMLGVSETMKNELEEVLPDTFQFRADRDYADYVYLRSNLATLSGKKYQPKRNFLNRFRNQHPDYEYIPITPEHVDECLKLEEKWCLANDCDKQEGTGNERRTLTFALQHFEELGLTGGMLRVDNRIVAFTYGMPINYETYDVQVEKADTEVEGAYTMINYEFANHIPEQYIYINREEDLGIPGLRKAKLSYHPAILLEKYVACLQNKEMEEIKW